MKRTYGFNRAKSQGNASIKIVHTNTFAVYDATIKLGNKKPVVLRMSYRQLKMLAGVCREATAV